MSGDYFLEFRDNKLLHEKQDNEPSSSAAQYIHSQFRTLALHAHFPLSHIRTAFQKADYYFGVFEEMGHLETIEALKSSLDQLIEKNTNGHASQKIFVSCYKAPVPIRQEQLFLLLRQTLQKIIVEELKISHFGGAFDSASADFTFCYCHIHFAVASIFSDSPFFMRRFGWPSLIFYKLDVANKNYNLID